MKKQLKVLFSLASVILPAANIVACGTKHDVLAKDINDWNIERMLDNTAFNNVITNYNGYSLNKDASAYHSGFWDCTNDDWFSGSDVPSRQLKYYEENEKNDPDPLCKLIDISKFGESLLYYYEKNSQNYGDSVIGLKNLSKDDILQKITDNVNFTIVGTNPDVKPQNNEYIGYCFTLEQWKARPGWEGLDHNNKLKDNTDLWTPWKYTQETMSTSSFLAYYFNIKVSLPTNSLYTDSHKSSWSQAGSSNTQNTNTNRIIFIGGEASINSL